MARCACVKVNLLSYVLNAATPKDLLIHAAIEKDHLRNIELYNSSGVLVPLKINPILFGIEGGDLLQTDLQIVTAFANQS